MTRGDGGGPTITTVTVQVVVCCCQVAEATWNDSKKPAAGEPAVVYYAYDAHVTRSSRSLKGQRG
ncbi:hypothetical protein E2C01_045013 [Portunus trituberculatus]|uniref:Uncharacterized protein n=1 Tax=Portunus trituberculatus TaxID=210409 RepID=A0A5B7G1P5_PORTR|nr:hypothetical protein [Portunus trituberculatus]